LTNDRHCRSRETGITFDERREKSDGGRFASTGWKVEPDLFQFVSQRSSTVLRLGATTSRIVFNDTASTKTAAILEKLLIIIDKTTIKKAP